jgi:hypothetical protein
MIEKEPKDCKDEGVKEEVWVLSSFLQFSECWLDLRLKVCWGFFNMRSRESISNFGLG